ncbi:hypothetical protein [Hyphomicrobium sp. ghe19]|uniref:hypothetical protein n=1 Tax=Hyphomicrobium sp. ghe19 TaxID=2682968 RepID=UPI001366DD2B|nr:hypothetical protein HYPP_02418 [Hyphomicrobium sp. ghe19]
MSHHTRVGGAWKKTNGIFVRDSGSWKEVQNGYVNQGGVWKKFHSKVAATASYVTGGGASSSSQVSPAWPSQAQVGDLLLFVGMNHYTAGGQVGSSLTGWTAVTGAASYANVFAKIVTADDISSKKALSISGGVVLAWCLVRGTFTKFTVADAQVMGRMLAASSPTTLTVNQPAGLNVVFIAAGNANSALSSVTGTVTTDADSKLVYYPGTAFKAYAVVQTGGTSKALRATWSGNQTTMIGCCLELT